MLYVLAIIGVIMIVGGIAFVVGGIRTIVSDDNKLPLFFQAYSGMNKAFAGIAAFLGVVVAGLGGWMTFTALTGG